MWAMLAMTSLNDVWQTCHEAFSSHRLAGPAIQSLGVYGCSSIVYFLMNSKILQSLFPRDVRETTALLRHHDAISMTFLQ